MQIGRALKKERYRDLQDMGNLLQPAGADAVGALFVFLDLLEGQSQRVAKLLLAHAVHHAAHTDPAPHVLVDGIGSLLGDHNDLLYQSGSFLCATNPEGNPYPSGKRALT